MTTRITKHFVTVGTRRVHYTRAGSGPAVCLFHPSPCSAKRMRPQQEVFASRFTALAFDNPGFGLSDKLPLAKPELTDFADAFAETLTALGIMRTAVYGNHTGAAIAVEFAARHPDRCAMAIADGYPAYSSASAEDRLKRYLEPIVPKWDGSHLLWLWYRYREQHVFWPWHDHDLAHRADTDVPDAEFLHQGVIDLLDAGDDYRIGYAAAFRGRGLKVLPDLKVPVCFTLRPGDSLYKTKPMYEGTSAWVVETPRDALEATVREMEILSKHVGDVPPEAPACAPIAGRTTTSYIEEGLGQKSMFVRRAGEPGKGRPLLLIHDLPGSSALLDDLVLRLGAHRDVIAPDLTGMGQSPQSEPDVYWNAPQLLGWLDLAAVVGRCTNSRECDVVAVGGAAMFALRMIAAAVDPSFRWGDERPIKAKSLTLIAPPALTEQERRSWQAQPVPSAVPEMDGTHLLRVWHHLRDMELWQPWFDRRREKARKTVPRIDPAALTVRAREMLKRPDAYASTWTSVFSEPLDERLAAMPRVPTLLLSSPSDLFAQCLPRAAALLPHAKVVEVEDSDDARAAAIEAFLVAL
ncbi:MAG: alpha/beta hydrolase [Alphaproteobacteria bacterium]|nr:alpha/beta hydrolase [Alphaproteobacteria bacterium]